MALRLRRYWNFIVELFLTLVAMALVEFILLVLMFYLGLRPYTQSISGQIVYVVVSAIYFVAFWPCAFLDFVGKRWGSYCGFFELIGWTLLAVGITFWRVRNRLSGS